MVASVCAPLRVSAFGIHERLAVDHFGEGLPGSTSAPEVVRTVAERQDRYQVQCSRDLQQLDDLLSLSVSITKRYRQRGRDEVESQLGYDEAIPCVPGTGIYHTISS